MRTLLADHVNNLGLKFQNMVDLVIDGVDITLAVKNFPFPHMTTETVEISHGNSTVYLAGRTKSGGSTSVTLRDFLEADVVGNLLAWRNQVFNTSTGATGRPKDYKKTATAYRYDNAGEVVEKWIIKGLFPLSVDLGSGDYDAGDPCEIALELSFDNVNRSDESTVGQVQING